MRAELIPCKFAVCLYLYITESYSQVFLASSPVQLLPCGFCSLGAKLCTWQQFLLQHVVCFKSWPINWIKLTHKRYKRECVYEEKSLLNSDYNGVRRRRRREGIAGESRLSFSFFYFCKKSSLTQRSVKGKRRRRSPFTQFIIVPMIKEWIEVRHRLNLVSFVIIIINQLDLMLTPNNVDEKEQNHHQGLARRLISFSSFFSFFIQKYCGL